MKIYGIQFTDGGIPNDPLLFTSAIAAQVAWIDKWHQWRVLDGRDGPYDLDSELVLDPEAVEYFSDAEGESEWRRWEVEVSEANPLRLRSSVAQQAERANG